MKRMHIFTRSRIAAFIACIMLCGILAMALPSHHVWADSGHPIQSLKVNGTNIDEFKIIHLTTAAETALRPTVKNADKFSLGAAAAAELKQMIKDATGAELSVETTADTSAPVDKAIVLAFDPSMQEDAFSVTISGTSIVIKGGTSHGIWYGLYDFLEEALGYRFFTKTIIVSDATFVNQAGATVDIASGSVNLKDRTWSEAPVFTYRSIHGFAFGELAEANGIDMDTRSFIGVFDEAGIRANLTTRQNGMDDDKWGLAYPQWGSGKGTVMSHAHAFESLLSGSGLQGASGREQPCLTDETTYNKTLEEILWLIRWETDWDADPTGNKKGFPLEHTIGENIHQISVGLNDNSNYCYCDNCKAKIAELGSLSDVYMDFVNRIAAEVKKEFGDGIQIMALAYLLTAEPPTQVVPADNVDVLYCDTGCNNHSLKDIEADPSICEGPVFWTSQDSSQKTNRDNLKGWAAITDNLYVWEYVDGFIDYLAPSPIYTYIYEQFTALADFNIMGIYAEARGDSGNARYGFEDLLDYLMGRLLWNPHMTEAEYEQYTKEFLSFVYGGSVDFEGTDDLYEYLLAWDKGGNEGNPHCWMNLNFAGMKAENNLDYYAENGADMLALLDRVLAKTQTEAAANRIRSLQVVTSFLMLSGQYGERYAQGDDASKAAYIKDYNDLYALTQAAGINDIDSEYVKNEAGKWVHPTVPSDPHYTTQDGINLDYCPMNWYRFKDGDNRAYTTPYYMELQFMMNDGTNTVYQTKQLPSYFSYAPQTDPVRPGYIFAGWQYYDKTADNTLTPFVFNYRGTRVTNALATDGVLKLYASWVTCSDHTFDEGTVTTEATYKADGVKTYTCTKCGETKTESIPKLVCDAHTWDEGKITKKPTASEKGEKTYTCTKCGETKVESLIYNPSTGDSQTLWIWSVLLLLSACAVCAATKRRSLRRQ